MKNVSRHQHDKNRWSWIATVDSCFALVGARQYCVAKICNASPTANAHKLQNDSFTISSSELWTHLSPAETRVATSCVSGRKELFKCLSWLCLATYIFWLFETLILTLCLLTPRITYVVPCSLSYSTDNYLMKKDTKGTVFFRYSLTNNCTALAYNIQHTNWTFSYLLCEFPILNASCYCSRMLSDNPIETIAPEAFRLGALNLSM